MRLVVTTVMVEDRLNRKMSCQRSRHGRTQRPLGQVLLLPKMRRVRKAMRPPQLLVLMRSRIKDDIQTRRKGRRRSSVPCRKKVGCRPQRIKTEATETFLQDPDT